MSAVTAFFLGALAGVVLTFGLSMMIIAGRSDDGSR